DPESDPRIAPLRLIETGGVRIAALFDLAPLGLDLDGSPDAVRGALAKNFGTPVDAVAFAATHEPAVLNRAGILFVNPGSPTLPAKPGPRGLGTVAILQLRDGVASAEVVDL